MSMITDNRSVVPPQHSGSDTLSWARVGSLEGSGVDKENR
jgi:hypothetical protein